MNKLPEIPEKILKRPELSEWCIIHGYRGSIAHELYVGDDRPSTFDDIDTMAVCIPPIDQYFGLRTFGRHNNGTIEIKEGAYDIVVYELRKFIKLLLNSNPNTIPLLWLEIPYYIDITEAGWRLVTSRDLFLSKKAYKSFVGCAHGQLKRMTHNACEGYMGDKRKKLVEQFGYDTKNASHLIRYLHMGIEILLDHRVYVSRKGDAQELLDIKQGKWTLDEVKERADYLFTSIDAALKASTLKEEPDYEGINELCVDILENYHDL